MGKTVLDLTNINFFGVFLHFLFKKSKNTFHPVAGFKKVFVKQFFCWFWYSSQHFLMPYYQWKKQHKNQSWEFTLPLFHSKSLILKSDLSNLLLSLFKKERPKANCSCHPLIWAVVSKSLLLLFTKERPWANRSDCSVKKRDINDLIEKNYIYIYIIFFTSFPQERMAPFTLC